MDAETSNGTPVAGRCLSRREFLTGTLAITALALETPALAQEGGELVSLRRSARDPKAEQSAQASVRYLTRVMDEFHTRFPVYDDVSSAGNHFFAWARVPDAAANVEINGSWTTQPHSGATCIRCVFHRDTIGTNFGGFYFLNGILPDGAQVPEFNFGTVPNAGIDLSGATALTFWARGETGGEVVEFLVGGAGRNTAGDPQATFPDSSPAIKTRVRLTRNWRPFRIDLRGRDLRYVLNGFGWLVSAVGNAPQVTFYLDDIQYELSPARRARRLGEPRFLRSFITGPYQEQPQPVGRFDLVLRNSAFAYDNALALLAFLADGSPDSLRRARLIGDAFVYAAGHDRTYTDGRIRSDYSAGDLTLAPGWTPNNRIGTVPVTGFYDEAAQRFFEIEQNSIDTGNNAWVMIALLALYRQTQGTAYLDTARRIGEFVRTFRNESGAYHGFLGGINDPEGTPTPRPYASTEHNIDLYAAFTVMAQVTGDTQWAGDAEHARQFVEAMWDEARGCYLAGTTDPDTRNTNPAQLPVDVQDWSVLAIPGTLARHPQVLTCAEANHLTTRDGFTGFDFNADQDGVWFEGTAQMAVAYALAGAAPAAEAVRRELRRAQKMKPFGDGEGLVAASHDGVTTGFDTPTGPFLEFRRLATAPTAWNVFAQLRFNPYYQVRVAP